MTPIQKFDVVARHVARAFGVELDELHVKNGGPETAWARGVVLLLGAEQRLHLQFMAAYIGLTATAADFLHASALRQVVVSSRCQLRVNAIRIGIAMDLKPGKPGRRKPVLTLTGKA